tara:strand:- start:841 stop:2130 length:1290 start_codon:yes stop_codon:yes gene_type:complete
MPEPKGTNDLGSKEIFEQREIYKEAYPTGDEFYSKTSPIDLWNDHKLLYGRVDTCGNPVFLRQLKLLEIASGDDGPMFVADVVGEAYEEMQGQILKAQRLNRLDVENSKIFPLEPVRTWKSIHQDYHKYLLTMYRVFITSYLNQEVDRRVVDYNTFEKEFLKFYETIKDKFIFTRTAYITSRLTSPLMSGLAMEFSDADHGNDKLKYDSYIQDPAFNFYRDITRRYGFVIDKNAPWRIIADIGSEPMAMRIKEKGSKNLEEFFENYYYSAHRTDVDAIAGYMHKMWDTFAALNPLFIKLRLSNCGPEVITETIHRRRISLNDFKVRYKYRYWLKLYIKIRNIETNKNLPEQQIKLVTKNALDLYNYKGKNEALDYIQKVFAGFANQTRETKLLTEQEIVATIQEAQTQVMTPTVSPTVINEFAEVIPEY